MHMMMSPIVAIVLVGPTAGTPSAHQACQKSAQKGLSEKDYAWIYDKNRSLRTMATIANAITIANHGRCAHMQSRSCAPFPSPTAPGA